MIIAFLASLAASPQTAVDAERAFHDMAQKQGQWTAFRAFAAPDALFFAPGPVNAQQWLKDRKDPPAAVHWWPARSWVSCDGQTAINIGPALYGTKGYSLFTTVWQRQRDGSWKWLLDQGHRLPRAYPTGERPVVSRAACTGRPNIAEVAPPIGRSDHDPLADALAKASTDLLVLGDDRMPGPSLASRPVLDSVPIGAGSSPDRTLHWRSNAVKGGGPGARVLQLFLWDGKRYRLRLLALHEARKP